MSIFEIPLRSDLPSLRFSIELDSEVFVFQFNWNTRNSRWFFDILLQDDTPVIMGQPVFVNYHVLDRFKDTRLPKGKIRFYDTSGKFMDPDRRALGERVQMFYQESA